MRSHCRSLRPPAPTRPPCLRGYIPTNKLVIERLDKPKLLGTGTDLEAELHTLPPLSSPPLPLRGLAGCGGCGRCGRWGGSGHCIVVIKVVIELEARDRVVNYFACGFRGCGFFGVENAIVPLFHPLFPLFPTSHSLPPPRGPPRNVLSRSTGCVLRRRHRHLTPRCELPAQRAQPVPVRLAGVGGIRSPALARDAEPPRLFVCFSRVRGFGGEVVAVVDAVWGFTVVVGGGRGRVGAGGD